jgi:hypothetical protein
MLYSLPAAILTLSTSSSSRASAAPLATQSVSVCREAFKRAWGMSQNKLTAVLKVVRAHPSTSVTLTPVPHGNRGARYETDTKKSARTRAFWDQYYDIVCNKIMEHGRSPPSDQVKRDVYHQVFVKWFANAKYPANELPCLSTFKKSSKHLDFRDVVPRAKHFHTRCTTCANLSRDKSKHFGAGDEALAEYVKKHKHHQEGIAVTPPARVACTASPPLTRTRASGVP